jgi:hypothetical protein
MTVLIICIDSNILSEDDGFVEEELFKDDLPEDPPDEI